MWHVLDIGDIYIEVCVEVCGGVWWFGYRCGVCWLLWIAGGIWVVLYIMLAWYYNTKS